MEIITSDTIEKLTGQLWGGCGYAIKTRQLPDGTYRHFSARIAPLASGSYDPLHWNFIKALVDLADSSAEMCVTDIRISVRELAAAEYQAHHYHSPSGTDNGYKPWVRRVVKTLRLALKHDINASTRLNAKQTKKVIELLEQRDEGKVALKELSGKEV